MRAGVAGVVTALALLPVPARALDKDEGYPEGWPTSVPCPTAIQDHELVAIQKLDSSTPEFTAEDHFALFCWYGTAPGRYDKLVEAEWGVTASPANDYLCADDGQEDENYVLRYSDTRRARVDSNFGTPSSDLVAEFLRIAESLAAPCEEPEEEPSTSTTSTTEGEDDEDEPAAGPCAIDGVVTAPDDAPLAGVVVELDGPGRINLATTATGADGRYHFDAPTGTDRFAPERDDVEVVVRLRDPNGWWDVWHADATAGVRTESFPVARASCDVDIDLGDLDALAGATPAEDDRWPAMVAITRRIARAARFTADPKGLGFTMDNGLPVEIYAWCDDTAPVECPAPASATAREGAPFFRGGTDPHIALGPAESAAQGVPGCEGDSVGHEWGHAVTADLFGTEIPHPAAGRTNHGGYFVNRSSNDSWTEAFATFIGLQARKHGGGPRTSGYVWCGGGRSEREYEENVRAWSGNGAYEEWAVAGLLLDLEDGPGDYQRERVPSLVDRDVAIQVLPGPKGKVVVGRVLGRTGPDVSVRIDLLRGGDEVGGGAAEVDAEGWFYAPVGQVAFTSVRAYGVRGGGRGADDDPLDLTPRQVWDAVAAYDSLDTRGERPVDVTGVFDVDDLHDALAGAFAGDRDRNGIDDVDQLFRDHGYFADPTGARTYAPGVPIGRSDRPLPGGGASVERHDVVLPPATRVAVDAGDADASFIVAITYPAPDHALGWSYVAEPGADGRIDVSVPPEDSGATATILAVAPGRLPTVVEVLEPDAFWADAAEHDGPFLDLAVALPRGELDGQSSGGAPPVALGAGLLGVGAVAALVGRGRRPVLLVAVALAGAGIAIGAWSLLGGDGDRPGTEVALGADPVFAEVTTTTVADETTTTTMAVSSTTTAPGDPDAVLTPAGWSSSAALADSASASYGAEHAGDGVLATAWCVEGDGAGATITASFDEPTAITVLGLVPGYDKDDRWDANRRVVTITWSFDDGTSFPVELTGEREMQYQALGEPIVTEHVTLTVDRTDGPSDTCVSEIELRGHSAP